MVAKRDLARSPTSLSRRERDDSRNWSTLGLLETVDRLVSMRNPMPRSTRSMLRISRSALSLASLVALGGSLGCAGVVRRFALRDPVWVDEDLRPVSVPCRPDPEHPGKKLCRPEEYVSPFAWDVADKTVFRPIAKFFAADAGFEARNVNSMDEVPDSSWFTNRIGLRPMIVDDILRGSCGKNNIDPAKSAPGTWVIDLGKANGANPGFRVNIEGVGKFMLKADQAVEGEKATGATAIASRFYNAAGWWTVCDTVVYLHRSLLKLTPGLMFADNSGVKRLFGQAELDGILDAAQTRGDLVRMVASRWLSGRTLGPFEYEETRKDDPNDVIAHEDRRDLRGARLMAAWLGHFDSREQNTMTTWAALAKDAKDASPGHTIHWYIDLGDCFGSHWEWESLNRRIGHSYYFDPGDVALDFITLGIPTRPWDRQVSNPAFEVFDYFRADFEPDAWKGGYPNPAFARMTELDGAWAARIISRFDDERIAATVKLGDYTDSRHTAFLTKTLIGRRDAIRRRYFANLSPVTDVRVSGDQVCGTDLARETGTWPEADFRYAGQMWSGGQLTQKRALTVAPAAKGEVCVTLPRLVDDKGVKDDDESRYAVVDVENGLAPGPLRMHFYDLGKERGYKLVGIERPTSNAPDF